MFPESFDKIGSMQGIYSITLDPNVSQMQHRRHRVPIKAKEEAEAQLKEMTS